MATVRNEQEAQNFYRGKARSAADKGGKTAKRAACKGGCAKKSCKK